MDILLLLLVIQPLAPRVRVILGFFFFGIDLDLPPLRERRRRRGKVRRSRGECVASLRRRLHRVEQTHPPLQFRGGPQPRPVGAEQAPDGGFYR